MAKYICYCVIALLMSYFTSGWVIAVNEFQSKDISDNSSGWKRSSDDEALQYTCDSNDFEFIKMREDDDKAYKTFTLLPHYQVKVIVDLYFMGSWESGRYGRLKIDGTEVYKQYYSSSGMSPYYQMCKQSSGGGEGSTKLEIKTLILQQTRSAANILMYFDTSLDETDNRQMFGFRFFQIYIKKCHYSCKFCSGPANTQCTACFTGSPNGGGQCSSCSGNTQFLDPGKGCILQCDRDGYLGDSNNICIENPNINSLDSAFTGASISSLNPWVGVVDSIFSTTSITNRYTTCSTVAIIGPFQFNEAVQYSLSLSTAIQYIRVRATFYLFNTWQDYAAIQIMLDDYPMGSIYSLTNNILSRNAIILSQSSVASCNSMSPVKIIRIEIIIRTTSTSPVLKFKGNMNPTSTQAWGGRDFTIDSQVCQSNCATCSNAMTCTSCSGGLKLHKGTCVSTCPTHSATSGSNCIDFDEAVSNAMYLVKAFYDSSSTTDEMVASLVDSANEFTSPNFETGGVYFSHIPNKRILGGALVWNKAGFTKSFTITQPHYAVRVVMSVILGDDFSGTFKYTFHTNSEVTLTSSSGNLGSGSSSIWGKSNTDKTVQIDVVVPHTTSTFQVVLKCQSTQSNIQDNFCAVQDYFIVVHLCRQFCLSSCTNASVCSSALTLPANLATSSPIACNTGFYYDSTTMTCPACSTIGTGCVQCTSSTVCTTCATNFQTSSEGCRCQAQFYLNGSSCSACSPYCNTCYNSGQTNCLECYTAQFRYLSVNSCLCIDYYYDDGTNTTCQACFPLCKTCTNAPNGNCSACSPATNVEKVGNFCNCKPTFYYHTTSKDCQTCEFTCYYCNGGNSNNCTNYDDANRNRVQTGNTCPCKAGYYQNASNIICSQCVIPTTDAVPACYHLCGNGIVEWNEECDDMNALPYDGCFGCYFQCQPACTTCTNGICSACNTSGWLFEAISQQCYTTCGDLIIAGTEQCDDGNDIMFDGCYNCSYQCQIECTNCVNGLCYACSTGWYVNTIDRRCYSQCGDQIVVGTEQCDDDNNLPYDGCYFCQYQCQIECTNCINGQCYECNTLGWYINNYTRKCETLCQDGIQAGLETCDDGNMIAYDGCFNCQYSCQVECSNCVSGVCVNCVLGWQLSEFSICIPVCGDLIVVGFEQCDDGNNLFYDGCYLCQYQCQMECTNCINGQCYECNTLGWYINNYTRKCETLCQDGIQAGLEICDDGNMIAYDGCFNCQYSCQVECSNCVSGVCVNCFSGWELNQDSSICTPICGDLIIVGSEQCDDGNYLEFDGCLNCSYQCLNECSSCNYGVCANCILGYKLNQFIICEQVCGDLILVGTEECDDGNDIPFDGCHNCQYSCQPQCTLCQQGICRQCNESLGWYLNTGNSQCETFCSDLILAGYEQCEDSNYLPNDGCFECNYSCPSNCLTCYEGICSNCQVGYNLVIQTCEPICGDGLIVYPEVCDDSNDQQFDGCFQCQYQCQEECSICLLGRCHACVSGWHFNTVSMQCETSCGDLIVAGSELCEDPNNLPHDGCYQCQYQCQFECLTCLNGRCLECQGGFSLIDDICTPICGDGIKVEKEECDDGNQISFDGCHSCQFQCNDACTNCHQGVCLACNQPGWTIQPFNSSCITTCGDSIVAGNEQCEDGNSLQFDGCYQCEFQCQNECLECYYGDCQQCREGWMLLNEICIPICGDLIIAGNEVCDDGNDIPFDGCYECQYSCQDVCTNCASGVCLECGIVGWQLNQATLTCQPICGDLMIVDTEECEDGNDIPYDGCHNCRFSCQKECTSCQFGICIECNTLGWILDNQSCETVCGDNIAVGLEDCDDGNSDRFDGCDACHFSCQKSCTRCLSGACFECNTVGWKWDEYKCQSICGDGMIVGTEECDDGNDNRFDGCFNCNYECQQECTSCLMGTCQECNTIGWTLQQQECVPYCGDGIVISPQEDCDDGNFVSHDGCFQCQYQCQQECMVCRFGECLKCDNHGWILQNRICVPNCGDEIITGEEECDDGNQIEFDGCYNCQYQCHQGCVECNNGKCVECILGLYVDMGTCISVCGDGVISTLYEQCDDGNIFNQDGCDSNCNIEEDWVCQTEFQLSNCFYYEAPIILLTSIYNSPSNSEQHIQLTFSSQVKLQNSSQYNNLEKMIIITIDNLKIDEFDYSITIIEPAQHYINQVEAKIIVHFYISITDPAVEIVLTEDFLNEYNVGLQSNTSKIVLQTVEVLTSDQLDVAESAQEFNEIIIYTLIGLAAISALTASFEMVYNLLDTLQYLSYVKYINYRFPPNLNIYFEIFNQVSMDPILQFLGVNELIGELTGSDTTPFIETDDKFADDSVNAYFLTNIMSFIFVIVSGYLTYLIYFIIMKFMQQLGLYQLRKAGKQVLTLFLLIKQQAKQFVNSFHYSGLLRILMSSTYDISFAVMIQLAYPMWDNPNFIISYCFSVIFLFCQFGLVFFLLDQLKKSQNKQKQNKSQYASIYEGVNTNQNNFWSVQYNSLTMIKKLGFIMQITCLNQVPAIQAITISLNSALFLSYLLLQNPLLNRIEHYKLIISESVVLLATLSFLLYDEILGQHLVEHRILVGWTHIVMFSFILTTQVALDIYQQIYQLYQMVTRQTQQVIKTNETLMFY